MPNTLIYLREFENNKNQNISDKETSHYYLDSHILNHSSMYNENNFKVNEYLIKDIYKYKLNHKLYIHEQFFTWFKEYFPLFIKTYNFLINEDGYLPKTWRLYIALMTVSYSKCEYLFRILEEEFLESGGDEAWLIFGFDVIPDKLKRISKICSILSFQPWRINKENNYIEVISFF